MRCVYCGQYNTVASFEGDLGVRVGEYQVCGEGYHRRLNRAKRVEYEISQLHPFEPRIPYAIPTDDTENTWYIKSVYNGVGWTHRRFTGTYGEAKDIAREISRTIYIKDRNGKEEYVAIEANWHVYEFFYNGKPAAPGFYKEEYMYKGEARQVLYVRPIRFPPTPKCGGAITVYASADEMNAESIQRQRENWEINHALSIKRIQEEWA